MANSGDSKTEERIAAINYVVTFYKDLQQLLHFYSLYINSCAENKAQIETGKLGEEEKALLKTILSNIRYHSTKCKLFVTSMGEEAKLGAESKKAIDEAYKNISTEFIPKTEDLETYVTELNKFFVSQVAKNILLNNAELLDKIYGSS